MNLRRVGMYSGGALLLIFVIFLFATGRVRIDLFRSNASGSGESILYGQNFGVVAGVDLKDKNVQIDLLRSVRNQYGRDWDMDMLAISADIPVIPPNRAILYFNQVIKSALTQHEVEVEGGFVSLIVNEPGMSDDVLSDSYIYDIKAQEPQLSESDARSKIVTPLNSEISKIDLVYHLPFSTDRFRRGDEGPIDIGSSGQGANAIDGVTESAAEGVTESVAEEVTPAPAPAQDTEIAPETTPETATEATQIEETTETPADTPTDATPIVEESESVPSDEGGSADAGGGSGASGVPVPREDKSPSPIIREMPTFGPQYRLAYRMEVANALLPYLPSFETGGGGRERIKGFTESGSLSCSKDSECTMAGQICVSSSCQMPSQANQFCNTELANHDCASGLVCNSITNSCLLPLLMQSCRRDTDCNSNIKSSNNFCDTDMFCKVKPSLQVRLIGGGKGLYKMHYCYASGGRPEFSHAAVEWINWNWGDQPMGTKCFDSNDDFTENWRGYIEVPASGLYTFYFSVDNYGSVTIDGKEIIRVTPGQGPGEYSGTINLSADKAYKIYVDMQETTGNARAILSWKSPTMLKEVVPAKYLYTENALPPFMTVAPKDVLVQEQFPATFSVLSNGTWPILFTWYHNDGVKSTKVQGPSMTNNFKIDKTTTADKGCYYVILTNDFGTVTSNCATLTVISAPSTSQDHGLHAYYYSDNLLSKLNNDELVKNLDVDWGTLSPIKLSCERCAVKEFDNWSARYYGKIYFPAAGTYYLGMDSDDGARIWLDGKLVMDNWYIPDELAVWSKVIQIDTPGEHLLRVEYWDGEGPAHAQLLWASNLLSFGGVVPSIYLTPLDWNPPLPNTKNGDVVWVDAVTGEIIDIINTIIEE